MHFTLYWKLTNVIYGYFIFWIWKPSLNSLPLVKVTSPFQFTIISILANHWTLCAQNSADCIKLPKPINLDSCNEQIYALVRRNFNYLSHFLFDCEHVISPFYASISVNIVRSPKDYVLSLVKVRLKSIIETCACATFNVTGIFMYSMTSDK